MKIKCEHFQDEYSDTRLRLTDAQNLQAKSAGFTAIGVVPSELEKSTQRKFALERSVSL